MHRYGAQITVMRRAIAGGVLATSLMYGANVHHHTGVDHSALHGGQPTSPHQRSNSVLLETDLGIGTRSSLLARIEHVEKNAQELGFIGGDLTQKFNIRGLTLAFTHDITEWGNAAFGFGARANVSSLPETLRYSYGTRRPVGYSLFAHLRPAVQRPTQDQSITR